jgi:hypothetical protein
MMKRGVTVLALLACLGALPSMVGLTGCAGPRYAQTTGPDDHRAAAPGYNQITDQGIEDGRTAARVREALAAGADYKYDGVKVIARSGAVQLSGFVTTSAQRTRAEEVTRKVLGVKSVENSLIAKN